MCGIIGVANKAGRPAANDIIFGLKALEYRGYDSAGAVLTQNFQIYRTTQNLDVLNEMISHTTQLTGLGHTRWATHGKICIANTHPIKIENTCIVHNGILSNAAEIKAKIGYTPHTETDTEILLALFRYFLKTHSHLDALEKMNEIAEGSYACAIAFANNDNIYWAKRGLSPLILATTEHGNIVTSDESAISTSAQIYEPANESFGMFNKDSLEIYPKHPLKSHKIEKKENTLKTTHASWLETEICEQSTIFKNEAGKKLELPVDLKAYDSVLLIGCGSAYIAATIGALWLEETGISAKAEIASEWNSRKSAEKNALVILISQSGETADTLLALRKAQACKLTTLAIVNKENSTIAKESDHRIFLGIGTEQSVASTKAFCGQLLKLYQIAHGVIPEHLAEAATKALQIDVTQVVQQLNHSSRAMILGKNIMHSMAMEGALKLKELTHINIEAYPASELKHGYIALVDANTIAMALLPTDAVFYQKALSNVSEVQTRLGKIILFAEKNECKADYFVQMPAVEYALTPFIYAIVLQRIALELTIQKNLPIDRPRNLAKAVTVE